MEIRQGVRIDEKDAVPGETRITTAR